MGEFISLYMYLLLCSWLQLVCDYFFEVFSKYLQRFRNGFCNGSRGLWSFDWQVYGGRPYWRIDFRGWILFRPCLNWCPLDFKAQHLVNHLIFFPPAITIDFLHQLLLFSHLSPPFSPTFFLPIYNTSFSSVFLLPRCSIAPKYLSGPKTNKGDFTDFF